MSNITANDSENPFGVSWTGLKLINNLVGSLSNNPPHKLPPNEAYKKFNDNPPPTLPESSNKDVASISLQDTDSSSHDYTFGSSIDASRENPEDKSANPSNTDTFNNRSDRPDPPNASDNNCYDSDRSNSQRKRPYEAAMKKLYEEAKSLYMSERKLSRIQTLEMMLSEVKFYRSKYAS